MTNSLSFLGLIRRAGKLEIGEESCRKAVQNGKAALLLSASDAAEASRRHAAEYAGDAIPHLVLPATKNELGQIIGRGTPGMLAVTDPDFAQGLVTALSRDCPGQYETAVQRLTELKTAARTAGSASENKLPKSGKRRNFK